MENLISAVIAIVLIVIFICFFGLFMAFPVKWAWNYVMPYLFDFKEIGWGHAWCLSFLAGVLIKSTQTNTNN